MGGIIVPDAATPIAATALALASTSTVSEAVMGGHDNCAFKRLKSWSTLNGGRAWELLKLNVSRSLIAGKHVRR